MSANCAEADKNRLLRSGASEYLVKPIQSESLAQLRRLVPSKVARDTQDEENLPDEEMEQHHDGDANQSVMCSSLLEAASQAMATVLATPGGHKPAPGQAAPADHSTSSELTGMDGPESQGHVRTPSPAGKALSSQPASDAANASSTYDASKSSSALSPIQLTGQVSGSPMLNVAVVMPPGMSPMAEQVWPPAQSCLKLFNQHRHTLPSALLHHIDPVFCDSCKTEILLLYQQTIVSHI